MTIIKRHPYIFVTIAASIFAVVTWMLVPKYYAARITVSDEYQETDLAVGMNSVSARIKKATHDPNAGIDDIEVYARALKTEDFARTLAKKQVPGKGKNYAEYLRCNNPIEEISDRLEYNIKGGMVLTVQLKDRDALIASQMLDSVMVELQKIITTRRHERTTAAFLNAKKAKQNASYDYHRAQEEYAQYYDAHFDGTTSDIVKQEIARLANERDMAYSFYQSACTEYVRQELLQKRSYESFAVVKANTVPTSDDSHLLGYIVCFLIPILAITKAYSLYQKRRKEGLEIQYGNIFSPWGITISIWGLMFVGLNVFSDSLYPVSQSFWIAISIWIIVFVISSLATFNLLPSNKVSMHNNGIDICMPIFNFFFYITLLFTPLYMYEVYKIVSMFDLSDIVANIRMLATKGDGRYGILNYTSVINQALLFISIWRYPKLPRWKLCLVILCCILCAIAKMEKITLFMVFVSVIYVLYEKKFIKKRTISLLGVSIVLLFFFFTLLRENNDGKDNEMSLLDFLCMYILSTPVAFGYLRQNISEIFCPNTLWVIYNIFDKLFYGIAFPHENFEEFVFVPISTNVFTILRPFYQDAGQMGVAYFALIYGILSGFLYRLAKNGNSIGICLYSYIVFTLALQFFDEMMFAALSQNIQRTLLIILICQTKFKFKLWARKSSIPAHLY